MRRLRRNGKAEPEAATRSTTTSETSPSLTEREHPTTLLSSLPERTSGAPAGTRSHGLALWAPLGATDGGWGVAGAPGLSARTLAVPYNHMNRMSRSPPANGTELLTSQPVTKFHGFLTLSTPDETCPEPTCALHSPACGSLHVSEVSASGEDSLGPEHDPATGSTPSNRRPPVRSSCGRPETPGLPSTSWASSPGAGFSDTRAVHTEFLPHAPRAPLCEATTGFSLDGAKACWTQPR